MASAVRGDEMSVARGNRRLLIALSGLYWIVGACAALNGAGNIQGQCVGAVPDKLLDTAPKVWEAAVAECHQPFWPQFGVFLLVAAFWYAVLAGVYFTVRWVVRGYRSPPPSPPSTASA